LLGQVSWFGWSRFDAIRVTSARGTTVQDQNYRDTWAVAAGADYAVNDRLTVRAGYQYDQTPTVDGFRTTRVPDGDRNWVAAGATWQSGRIKLNAGYAHVFAQTRSIDVTQGFYAGTALASQVTTRSTNRGGVNMLSLSAGYSW
jgi:long-chain fatty acid transport protein